MVKKDNEQKVDSETIKSVKKEAVKSSPETGEAKGILLSLNSSFLNLIKFKFYNKKRE